MEEALQRKRMNAVPPADTMSLWSEEECRAFETGLRVYGKDFYNIQNQKVGTRAVGELVQFCNNVLLNDWIMSFYKPDTKKSQKNFKHKIQSVFYQQQTCKKTDCITKI